MNCIIVHGCPFNVEKAKMSELRTYDKHWMPWVKRELIARGIPTEIPLMPIPWEPEYGRFKQAFEACHVDEETILIGHSCGCAFLVQWLGDTKQRVATLVLVSPRKIPNDDNPAKEKYERFYDFPIDRTISSRVGKIIIFSSDDEIPVGVRSVAIYQEALGGKIIELQGKGHYIMKHMGTEEFPELIEEVLR
jgi:uncharacterized protein